MLRPKISTLLVISLFSVFIFSCQENSVTIEDTVPSKQYRLIKVTHDANNYTSYIYADGKLQRYEGIQNSQIEQWMNFTYDNSSKLDSLTEFFLHDQALRKYHFSSREYADSMDYYYQNNDGSYSLVWKMKYIYNAENQRISAQQYTTTGILTYAWEYKYDQNGNIVEERRYNSKDLEELTTFTFDNKKNPMYNFRALGYMFMSDQSENNIIKMNTTDYVNPNYSREIIIEYTYDSQGYPIQSKIQSNPSGQKISYDQYYEYELY